MATETRKRQRSCIACGKQAGKAELIDMPDDHHFAIGKEGQNARLAARLTGCKIDIKPASQAEALEEAAAE